MKAVLTLLNDEEWSKWSDREIARRTETSHPFVGKIKESLTGNVSSEKTYTTKHGLRRTNADKRKAVLTLLNDEEWSEWSDREISRQCAVSPKTVSKYRRELTVEIPQSKERKGADGRTIDTSNIGKSEKPLLDNPMDFDRQV